MQWRQKQPAIERLAGAGAAASLCGATGFALLKLLPLAGATLMVAALCGALAAAAGGLALLRAVGADDELRPAFEPADYEADGSAEEELLLDDPIPAAAADSRVVRLFERDQPEPLPEPLPEPGELVARIADYLGSGASARPLPQGEPARVDASAALHAALADIRRSLR